MKKSLLLFLLCFSLIGFAQAQFIELIGVGVLGQSDPVLIISDPGTVDSVVIEAAATFRHFAPYNDPAPADVSFSDSNESSGSVSYSPVSVVKTTMTLPPHDWGYYSATFKDVDGGGITLHNTGQENYIASLVAYVYRTGGEGIYSEVRGDHAYLFRNGSLDLVVYDFTIPFSFVSRDVIVTVPFSDVNEDGRWSVVDVTAGALSAHSEFDDNNAGNRLHLETITLPDVPGDVTSVTVSIYSPWPGNGVDTKNGDSFITSAVVVTTTYDQGCTLTQGYWKTHSEYGPAAKPDATWAEVGGPDAAFFLSGQTYLEVLNTAVKGNAYYILAHQFIAAELNMYAGAYLGEVADEFSEAADLLALYTPDQIAAMKGNNPVRKMFVELGEMLDKFNNGIIGPGHCNDDDMEKSATIDSSFEISEFSVYPNPASNVTTLSFNPVSDGMAAVELYNSLGQKLEVLFNENVRRNVPVKVDFDVSGFNRGLYVLQLKNNTNISTTKFNIGN